MANHASSKKRIRRNARRTDINANRRNRMRTFIKKVELALGAGDAKAAEEAYIAAKPEMMRNATKGILPKKTAARKLSRLSSRIKALKQA